MLGWAATIRGVVLLHLLLELLLVGEHLLLKETLLLKHSGVHIGVWGALALGGGGLGPIVGSRGARESGHANREGVDTTLGWNRGNRGISA